MDPSVFKVVYSALVEYYGRVSTRPAFLWTQEYLHRPLYWIEDSNILIEVDAAEHFECVIPEVDAITITKLDMIKTNLAISNGFAVVRIDASYVKNTPNWRAALRAAITVCDSTQGKVVYLGDDDRYKLLKGLMKKPK